MGCLQSKMKNDTMLKRGEKMIDLEKAKEQFMKYTSKFDNKDLNIQRKIDHSFRVMGISQKIAQKMQLKQEEIELAMFIGLLHDIGRFKQYEMQKNYIDGQSVDHGDLGVKILWKEKEIRNFIKDPQYDEIIKKAIQNHNKYQLNLRNLTKQEMKFCQIIRDSDKIDIWYEATMFFWKGQEEKVEKETISKEVWESFKSQKLIEHKQKKTISDQIVGLLSYIFDINFKETFEILKEENYLDHIINRFCWKNEETKKRIQEIQKLSQEYINEKTK